MNEKIGLHSFHVNLTQIHIRSKGVYYYRLDLFIDLLTIRQNVVKVWSSYLFSYLVHNNKSKLQNQIIINNYDRKKKSNRFDLDISLILSSSYMQG